MKKFMIEFWNPVVVGDDIDFDIKVTHVNAETEEEAKEKFQKSWRVLDKDINKIVEVDYTMPL